MKKNSLPNQRKNSLTFTGEAKSRKTGIQAEGPASQGKGRCTDKAKTKAGKAKGKREEGYACTAGRGGKKKTWKTQREQKQTQGRCLGQLQKQGREKAKAVSRQPSNSRNSIEVFTGLLEIHVYTVCNQDRGKRGESVSKPRTITSKSAHSSVTISVRTYIRNLVTMKLLWNLWTGYTVPVFPKSGPGGP